MRATVVGTACLLALGLGMGSSAMAALTRRAIDECRLLTVGQARTIMQAEPFDGAVPEREGCSWQTDPSDREHFAYVVVDVHRRTQLLRRYHNDLHRYLDQSTNVGIDRLRRLGDKAFSTYSPLSGPGSADGIWVVVGSHVVEVSWQATTRTLRPSAQLDHIVTIVKKVVAKIRRG